MPIFGNNDSYEIIVYRKIDEICLHGFEIDYKTLEGTFQARIDGKECPWPFEFRFDVEGRHRAIPWIIPWRHTDLRTMVEIPADAQDALDEALRALFPDIKAHGRDKKTGETISWQTPLAKRLSSATYMDDIRKTTGRPDFAHIINVKSK